MITSINVTVPSVYEDGSWEMFELSDRSEKNVLVLYRYLCRESESYADRALDARRRHSDDMAEWYEGRSSGFRAAADSVVRILGEYIGHTLVDVVDLDAPLHC